MQEDSAGTVHNLVQRSILTSIGETTLRRAARQPQLQDDLILLSNSLFCLQFCRKCFAICVSASQKVISAADRLVVRYVNVSFTARSIVTKRYCEMSHT